MQRPCNEKGPQSGRRHAHIEKLQERENREEESENRRKNFREGKSPSLSLSLAPLARRVGFRQFTGVQRNWFRGDEITSSLLSLSRFRLGAAAAIISRVSCERGKYVARVALPPITSDLSAKWSFYDFLRLWGSDWNFCDFRRSITLFLRVQVRAGVGKEEEGIFWSFENMSPAAGWDFINLICVHLWNFFMFFIGFKIHATIFRAIKHVNFSIRNVDTEYFHTIFHSSNVIFD